MQIKCERVNALDTILLVRQPQNTDCRFAFAGPHTLASCGNLTLSGSQSFGGGGRPLIYKWNLTSPNKGQDVTNITNFLNELSLDAVRVKLPGTMFEIDTAYEFQLKVANFLYPSSFEEVTHVITKAAEPVPALTLSSGIELSEGEVYVSEDLSIKASAIVSTTAVAQLWWS